MKPPKLPEYLLSLCRHFRKHPTDTEAMLWECLRNRRLCGLKFRRQHPIGRYITDFYCHERKLILEVDGSIHERREQRLYDAARQSDLEGQGYTVVRVSANDVKIDLAKVLLTISLSPIPSPSGRGGRGEGQTPTSD